MKIELEGREALQHTNAVHILHSLGYQFVGAEWVVPQEEPQEVVSGTVFIGEALISTGGITKADTQLQADIEALTKRLDHLELATNHENFCADVRLRIIHEQFPGGVLYGIKK